MTVLDLCVFRAEENENINDVDVETVLDLCVFRAEENAAIEAATKTASFRPMCF